MGIDCSTTTAKFGRLHIWEILVKPRSIQKDFMFKFAAALAWATGITRAIYSVSYFIKGNLNEGGVSLISSLIYFFIGYSLVKYSLEKNKKTIKLSLFEDLNG